MTKYTGGVYKVKDVTKIITCNNEYTNIQIHTGICLEIY